MAPETGLEPVTRRLTAGCSTIELLWNQSKKNLTNALFYVNSLRKFLQKFFVDITH